MCIDASHVIYVHILYLMSWFFISTGRIGWASELVERSKCRMISTHRLCVYKPHLIQCIVCIPLCSCLSMIENELDHLTYMHHHKLLFVSCKVKSRYTSRGEESEQTYWQDGEMIISWNVAVYVEMFLYSTIILSLLS